MENPKPKLGKQPMSSSSSSSSYYTSRVDDDDDAIESSGREEWWRNWAELGQDALSLIFEKAGVVGVLTGAQFVCRSWRNVSLVPSLWRLIRIDGVISWKVDMERMAMEAINRAQGHIQSFSVGVISSDALLSYLADRTSELRCLRLIPTYKVSCKGLAEVVGRFPLLEELEITFPSFTRDVFKLVGEACPHLKCFRYNQQGSRSKYYGQDDEDAFGIANHMPELRQLQIVGNMITNKGLLEILDKCQHLESLDLRRCFHVDLNASVRAKCARIGNLRCPNDATDDCGFIDEFDDYIPEDTEVDMGYEDFFHEGYYDYSEDDYEDYTDYSYLVQLATNFTL